MDSFRSLLLLSSLLFSVGDSQSVLKMMPGSQRSHHLMVAGDRDIPMDDELFCESWRYAVETNDAGVWSKIPSRCVEFVAQYVQGSAYASDSDAVSGYSMEFAQGLEIAGDGKDAWIFDIDETLLSNLPFYAAHQFGSELFNETAWNEWVELARAPPLPASLRLYVELQVLGFQLILLTGRTESQRNVTDENLVFAGYSSWDRLILRGSSDVEKTAVVYKSEKRMELEAEGYRIHGSSGDQWSDLLGNPMATRSFKLPNPMYYIE